MFTAVLDVHTEAGHGPVDQYSRALGGDISTGEPYRDYVAGDVLRAALQRGPPAHAHRPLAVGAGVDPGPDAVRPAPADAPAEGRSPARVPVALRMTWRRAARSPPARRAVAAVTTDAISRSGLTPATRDATATTARWTRTSARRRHRGRRVVRSRPVRSASHCPAGRVTRAQASDGTDDGGLPPPDPHGRHPDEQGGGGAAPGGAEAATPSGQPQRQGQARPEQRRRLLGVRHGGEHPGGRDRVEDGREPGRPVLDVGPAAGARRRPARRPGDRGPTPSARRRRRAGRRVRPSRRAPPATRGHPGVAA